MLSIKGRPSEESPAIFIPLPRETQARKISLFIEGTLVAAAAWLVQWAGANSEWRIVREERVGRRPYSLLATRYSLHYNRDWPLGRRAPCACSICCSLASHVGLACLCSQLPWRAPRRIRFA